MYCLLGMQEVQRSSCIACSGYYTTVHTQLGLLAFKHVPVHTSELCVVDCEHECHMLQQLSVPYRLGLDADWQGAGRQWVTQASHSITIYSLQ